ncbi:MAG TPA: hypothetical protein VJ302_09340, partial [Blastocatellia bacterium]|nr:hypothetical protein [Blastocatellia bacterium]
QVVYLGPNLPADEIAAAVKKVRAKAVALSLVWPEGNQDVDAEIHRWRNQRGSAVALIVGGRAAAFEGRFRRDVSEFKLTPNFSRIEMFDYIFTFKGFEYVKIIFAPGRVPGTVNLLVFKQTYERFKSPTELYLATELNAVQQMSPEELDLMSYGVITLDKEDRVTADNDWEARLAGASRYQVMHQHWFKRPAPCTRVDEFEGRYRAFKNGARSEMFNFIFPFSRGAQFINRTFLPARDYGSVNIVVFKRKLII